MQITIKTKDLDLTEPLKQYIEDKIGGLEKFLEKLEEQGELLCEIEVSRTSKHHKKGDVFYAEAILGLPGRRIRATDQEFDARVAIDRVRDVLQRQIVGYREKEGMTGKALRHMSRLGRGATDTAKKIMWWRNK
jgi:putative sigma-54 modulation protein